MQEIYPAIVDYLLQKKNVVLATIISEKGSAPRSSGTKMLICQDGSQIGTIGGGSLEAQAICKCDEVFAQSRSCIFHFVLTGKDAALSDMICGGSGDVLLQYISSDMPQSTEIFRRAYDASLMKQKAWIITQTQGDLDSWFEVRCGFVAADGTYVGHLALDEEDLLSLCRDPESVSLHSNLLEKAGLKIEAVHQKKVAYIFGGGHVSKEIVHFLTKVDFDTVVLDDRADYANAERFPESNLMVVEDYSSLPPLEIDTTSFIVIVTRGHLGDYDVLAQMLRTKAGYIGMIGSKTKRELIYKRLRENGFTQEQIDRVHSPIGLAIKAETPAEIAVSIVAEMILIRAEMK